MDEIQEKKELTGSHLIVLDCPPGDPRPDVLLPGILKDTGLEVDDFKLISTFFGEWTFRLKDTEKDDLYEGKKIIIGERIKDLHIRNFIRYGEW